MALGLMGRGIERRAGNKEPTEASRNEAVGEAGPAVQDVFAHGRDRD